MDLLYGHDRKLGYLEEESDMVDLLDSNGIFDTPLTGLNACMENYEADWFSSILEDPVLNDKMMTDAMQPPCIKSEHSYSINDTGGLASPLGLSTQEDMEADLFMNTAALDLTMKTVSTSPDKMCEVSPSPVTPVTSVTPRQPTIIVTTSTASAPSFFTSGDLSFPTIQIKQEPADCLTQANEQTESLEPIVLPPTPPGSSGSDSEGSQSPQRSAPSSPLRQHVSCSSSSCTSPLSPGKAYSSQPLFLNPISQSGVLILSEEEKRTLISEGYPIPSKLPLTKQEEKNLKKIRRKIKNKISAQESRRKKKEYLEALEKRVEAYNHENNDLKKKVESLENNNRSLLGQLHKLQCMVSKMPKVAAASATQTGTALMVLVFCFAMFLGSMSPSTLNIGYSVKPPAMLGFAQQHHQVSNNPYGPQNEMGPNMMSAPDSANPYSTPNLKSRMLMSVEQEEQCDEQRSMPWEKALLCPIQETADAGEDKKNMLLPGVDLQGGAMIPDKVKGMPTASDTTVVMVVTGLDNNNSDSRDLPSAVPDIALTPKELVSHDSLDGMTAELETA